jgi:hypothetical protein
VLLPANSHVARNTWAIRAISWQAESPDPVETYQMRPLYTFTTEPIAKLLGLQRHTRLAVRATRIFASLRWAMQANVPWTEEFFTNLACVVVPVHPI